MNEYRVHQETGRVLFAAAAVWATVMAAASVEGVTTKFDTAGLAAFGIGVSAFAAIAYRVDDELREYGRGIATPVLVSFAIGALGLWIAAAFAHTTALMIIASPFVALAAAALLDRPRRALRKSSAKSPGARPAAT